MARTFLVEHQADGVAAQFGSGKGILDAGDAAEFDACAQQEKPLEENR
jgi:hypothetical protein